MANAPTLRRAATSRPVRPNADPYESLEPGELDELMATLEPLAALLLAAQD